MTGDEIYEAYLLVQATWLAVTSPFAPARTATAYVPGKPPKATTSSSWATTLGATFPSRLVLANHFSFPVSGLSPQTSLGTAITSSLPPFFNGTIKGVP